MSCVGTVSSSDEQAMSTRSRIVIRYRSRFTHQQAPTTAAPLSIRQMPISTGPITCVTRSSKMNDVPQTKQQKQNARCATAESSVKGKGESASADERSASRNIGNKTEETPKYVLWFGPRF